MKEKAKAKEILQKIIPFLGIILMIIISIIFNKIVTKNSIKAPYHIFILK